MNAGADFKRFRKNVKIFHNYSKIKINRFAAESFDYDFHFDDAIFSLPISVSRRRGPVAGS